jgi:hypothetical protein
MKRRVERAICIAPNTDGDRLPMLTFVNQQLGPITRGKTGGSYLVQSKRSRRID